MAQKKAVILRIDPKLWNDLNIWAKDEIRSLNAQIEYVLREAIKKRTGESKK
ncbi:MAG: Arc family DNA binding domain-containing protein [Ignavibacteriae bacterium]|nr:Arc family DNA binding domain-containing protein [Ignavibacteriota bacterium]